MPYTGPTCLQQKMVPNPFFTSLQLDELRIEVKNGLDVENALGITKEDIGKKITIEDYNKEC